MDFEATSLGSGYRSRVMHTNNDGLLFFTNASTTPKMQINNAGQMVIASNTFLINTNYSNPTAVPYGYKLYVEGGILTEKVKVAIKNGTYWSDYVFEPDYQLLSLDSVETYTKEHKHLPGMPSADEVYKEGIDVAQMDALLLQQIEELWLQLMILKKENEELKKSLNK